MAISWSPIQYLGYSSALVTVLYGFIMLSLRISRSEAKAKKRILILANRIGILDGDTGGGSLFRESLMKSLEGEYEVTAVAVGRMELDWADTVRGPLLLATVKNLFVVFKKIRETDLVILSGSWTILSIWCSFISLLHGIPCCTFLTMNSLEAVNTNFTTHLSWGLAAFLYLATDHCNVLLSSVSYTRSAQHQLALTKFGIYVSGVVFHTVQYSAFSQWDSAADIYKARSHLSAGQPHLPLLLFAGRIIKEKRINLLIAAKPPGVVLAIVGGGKDVDEIAQYHDPSNGVVCHVNCRVEQSTLRVYMKACDIHVSASAFETLGNTVHEALLCQRPVVVQNAGGYVSQVQNGINGYLVDWADVAEAQAAVANVLGKRLTTVAPLKRDTRQAMDLVAELTGQTDQHPQPGAAAGFWGLLGHLGRLGSGSFGGSELFRVLFRWLYPLWSAPLVCSLLLLSWLYPLIAMNTPKSNLKKRSSAAAMA